MSSTSNQILEKLVGYLLFAFILIYVVSSYGFVITEFWDWFIVPIFNIEPITMLSAVGLLFFVSLFIIKLTVPQEYPASSILMFLLNPWITWCVGYTLQLFA